MSNDRTIHARTRSGMLIVRYDRAGKWYAERVFTRLRSLTLKQAVDLAVQQGSYVYLDQPGGKRFDAAVRKMCEGAR